MKKHEPIPHQIFDGDLDDVAGAREPCVSVSDTSFGLEAVLPQPSVGEGETLAAMVVLFIVDPDRAAVLQPPCNVSARDTARRP